MVTSVQVEIKIHVGPEHEIQCEEEAFSEPTEVVTGQIGVFPQSFRKLQKYAGPPEQE
jgi:hypothetical protein